MAGSRHLFAAIYSHWYAAGTGLDAAFKALRRSGLTAAETALPTIHEGEARPGTPLPYCVYSQTPGYVESRSSPGSADANTVGRHIRVADVTLRIHATATSSKTAKDVAADLGDAVLQHFGGSDSTSGATLAIAAASAQGIIHAQYQSDWFFREGDDEWSFSIRYLFRVDAPVKL